MFSQNDNCFAKQGSWQVCGVSTIKIEGQKECLHTILCEYCTIQWQWNDMLAYLQKALSSVLLKKSVFIN